MPLSFSLPASIDYPLPAHDSTKTRNRFLVTGLPIARRRREPGAAWTPRRHLLGWPTLTDEHDLDRWLAAATAPREVAYHLGNLPADRVTDRVLDLLARAVLARSCSQTLRTTVCGHLRGVWTGSGDIEARQQRAGEETWLYTVKRL
jgi:hypothetical protein